jgi:hypothetical protein
MNSVPEIRRERIIIPPEMTKGEIKEKYGLSTKRAREALKKGFFVQNYSKRQVIIDPSNFDPAISYSTAKRVYFKNFSWRPLAQSIKEDLIQEAVTRMCELSGKVKEGANGKYSVGYGYFWVAHNAMIAYLATWQKQMGWRVFGNIEDQLMMARTHPSSQEIL